MDLERAKQELKGKTLGIGYGYKVKDGKLTDIPAIIVYVKKKLPISVLSVNEIIPVSVEGLPTDVQEIKTVDALSYTERKRPVPGGYSVGHSMITAGSIGLPLVDSKGVKCLLSNSHVLSPYWKGEVKIDDPILQPGPVDGGQSTDVVAFLHSWIPMSDGDNTIDCALARVIEGQIDWRIEGISNVYEKVGIPVLGQIIQKVGRTTGFTKGRITTIGAMVYVRYTDTMTLLFIEQLEITPLDSNPYLLGGDSGSVALSEDGLEALGLNFAGGGGIGYANPMTLVQQALGFTIVKKLESETIEKQLVGLKGILVAIWGYDTITGKYSTYPKQSGYNKLKVLEKGKGYWLYLNQDIIWSHKGLLYTFYKGWNLFGYIS